MGDYGGFTSSFFNWCYTTNKNNKVIDLGVFGSNDDESIQALQKDLNDWYDQNPGTYKLQGKLNFARIRTTGDWPKLKAKAAATRHIIKYCKILCERYGTDSTHDKRRLALVCLLDEFYTICASEGRYLSDDAKRKLPKLAQSFMQLYRKLSKEAYDARERKWKFAPIFHLFQHLCERQMIYAGNGRFWWTYPDEDMQRVLKNIAVQCHKRTVAWMTMYRWAIVVFDDYENE